MVRLQSCELSSDIRKGGQTLPGVVLPGVRKHRVFPSCGQEARSHCHHPYHGFPGGLGSWALCSWAHPVEPGTRGDTGGSTCFSCPHSSFPAAWPLLVLSELGRLSAEVGGGMS